MLFVFPAHFLEKHPHNKQFLQSQRTSPLAYICLPWHYLQHRRVNRHEVPIRMGSRPTQYASSVSATIGKCVFRKIGDVNCEMTSQGGVTTSRNNAGCRMCRLEFYSELNGIEPTLTTTNLEQKVSWVFMYAGFAMGTKTTMYSNNKVDSHAHFGVALCCSFLLHRRLGLKQPDLIPSGGFYG